MMSYRIESKIDGIWDADYVAADQASNSFDTVDEAEECIEELRKLGDDWADGEYRVVEIEAEPRA